ncbi:hypothetical protein C823_006752 [Eubacterium plexicaudatum ASF492]|nr:hypothetical protein C823_006752 [Eubacterium plexicaudatum ASF492]
MSIEFIYPEFEIIRNENRCIPAAYASSNAPTKPTSMMKNAKL